MSEENEETQHSSPGAVALTEFISLEALAEALGVTKPTIGVWRRERALPSIRLGSRTFFHIPTVAGWLKAQETVTASSADDE